MSPVDAIRAKADIGEVAEAHGYTVRKKRAKHPDGDTFSVSLDRDNNLFFRHSTGEGGDVFDLVKLEKGGDFKAALQWLAEFYGVPLQRPKRKTPSSRYHLVRQQATDAAEELSEFRSRLTVCLREIRNLGWDAFNKAECLYRGPNRVADLPASEWRLLRRRLKLADERDRYITRLQDLPAAELIALRDRLEGSIAD